MSRLLPLAAVALGASLALAGCALIPMGPGAPGPDLGGDSAGTDSTDSTDSGATGDSDGSFSAGAGVDLPEGWPSEVPVPDGTIVTASHADDTYVLTVSVADEEAARAGSEALQAAGFELTDSSEFADGAYQILVGSQWSVSYNWSRIDDTQWAVTEGVSPAS